MKSDNPLKHFVLAFLIACVIYFVGYSIIEHRRNRKGPWQVTFTKGPAGEPSLIINQPTLRLTNVEISFASTNLPATNALTTLFFGQPRPVPFDLPFGKCVFMDTTFLPGSVAFRLFGHEIELLPRVLVIDRKEYPWQSSTNIVLN